MIAVQVKRRMSKGMRQVERDEYRSIERHPVRVISWADNPVNAGALLRTCEAYLVDRYVMGKTPAYAPTVGTSKWQPFVVGWDALSPAVDQARDDGFTVVALEITDASTPLTVTALPERMALLVGNEGSGLPKSALARADMAVEIPQYGFVGSLNLNVAAAIALYEWARQHREGNA